MATIRDVAKQAGVSVATVSRVLNNSGRVSEAARNAVLRAQAELGFVLNANARALAHQNSAMIGAVIADVSDPYYGQMARTLENTAYRAGAGLMICQGFYEPERELQAIENVLSHQCRALIVHAQTLPDRQLAAYMRREPSMVLINRALPGHEERCMYIDGCGAVRTAVRELLEFGHRRIAYVGSALHIPDVTCRLHAFRDALSAAGLEANEQLIYSCAPSLEGAQPIARMLLRRLDDLTAVVCCNDLVAVSIMSVFAEHGIRIPQRVSVTGFGNLSIARFAVPPLTTVVNPVDFMSHEAVMLSMALSRGERYTLPKFKTPLIRRHSVARPWDSYS